MQQVPFATTGEKTGKIKSFTDLIAWREAHVLSVDIYKVSKEFPKEELFGVTSQIRRSALSISSNIAEGFSRRSPKEKTQFYTMALSSLREVQNQLLFCKDVDLIKKEIFAAFAERTILISKLITGLIKNIPS